MIALIPGLQETLAYWRPPDKPDKPPLTDTFAQILENAAGSADSTEPPPLPTYEVQKEDNLWSIAKKFGLADPLQLARLNSLKNPDLLKVGQVLNLPRETPGGPPGTRPASSDPEVHLVGKDTPKVSLAQTRGSVRSKKGQLVVASWYGPNHHGKLMANGQPFDMYADTVAHPSLPFDTPLRLTNPANGRSVEVRVTDRGPFIPGRNLDLSYGVARKLGVVKAGVSRIYLEKG
jgi:LysM repeat protein